MEGISWTINHGIILMVIVLKIQLIKQGCGFPADADSHFIFQGPDQALKYSIYFTPAYATKHAIAKIIERFKSIDNT